MRALECSNNSSFIGRARAHKAYAVGNGYWSLLKPLVFSSRGQAQARKACTRICKRLQHLAPSRAPPIPFTLALLPFFLPFTLHTHMPYVPPEQLFKPSIPPRTAAPPLLRQGTSAALSRHASLRTSSTTAPSSPPPILPRHLPVLSFCFVVLLSLLSLSQIHPRSLPLPPSPSFPMALLWLFPISRISGAHALAVSLAPSLSLYNSLQSVFTLEVCARECCCCFTG